MVSFVGPDEEVAEACGELCLAVLVGDDVGEGVVFGIVVEFELDVGSGHELVLGCVDGDGDFLGGSVVGEEVEFGVEVGFLDDFFVAAVTAEGFGVDHHAAGGGDGEPAHVELGVGLAGAEEFPFTVGPYFDPGVIVVAVGPAGGVALAGGDADGAECCDGEGGLFAAAAEGGAHGGEGC